mgnify:CR=1 FL=1
MVVNHAFGQANEDDVAARMAKYPLAAKAAAQGDLSEAEIHELDDLLAAVPAPFEASSSGCAWTKTRVRGMAALCRTVAS